jgi:non-ribosomal peptide synthase protein (TIGR01720 family)
VSEVWADVLGLPSVGLHDNFFALGGDSIMSFKVISRLKERGYVVRAQDIFRYQTVARLAAVAGRGSAPARERGRPAVIGGIELSPVQHWLLAQDQAATHHYNQSVALVTRALDPALLGQALDALTGHHDILRARFTQTERGWSQEIPGQHPGGFLVHHDLTGLAPDEQERSWLELAERAQAGMNLPGGELVRAVLAETGPGGQQRLLLAIHHLAVDLVSWGILLEDLATAYRQLASGEPTRLLAKTASFQEWSARLSRYARTAEGMAELDLWASPRGGCELAGLTVPSVAAIRDEISHDVRLTADQTAALVHDVPASLGVSLEDVLLAGLAVAVNRWTGQSCVTVDVEGHGREELFDDIDLSRTVGWFTTIYPIELAVPAGAELAEIVHETARRHDAIPHRGIGYGILAWLADEKVRETITAQPRANIIFNYLGNRKSGIGDGILGTSADLPRGPEINPELAASHAIAITADVAHGIFAVRFTHVLGATAWDASATLAVRYAEALAEITRHAGSGAIKNRRFRYANVSKNDLAKIEQRLRRPGE